MNFSNLENFLSMFTDGKGQIDGKQIKKAYIGRGGVAKEFKKGYIEENGLARLFFKGGVDVSTMHITYSGNHTDQVVTMGDGKQYRLLTLTSTGTLTLEEAVNAEVWFCNGGENGTVAEPVCSPSRGKGGNGGKVRRKKAISTKTAVITIGAGNGGATSVKTDSETISAETFRPPQGGLHGGNSGTDGENGAGAEYSIIPFEDSYFTNKPCGGGGGGGRRDQSGNKARGGGGGSNTTAGTMHSSDGYGGYGGATGGGDGGHSYSATVLNGKNASYYGSGGGGAGWKTDSGTGSAGAGYQGVCFIRIPLEQSA